jgi:hypothetical protein
MERPDRTPGVIPARDVRRTAQPALVESGGGPDRSMTVLPHVDGDRIAALEVRCSCGNSVVVECEYEPEGT